MNLRMLNLEKEIKPVKKILLVKMTLVNLIVLIY